MFDRILNTLLIIAAARKFFKMKFRMKKIVIKSVPFEKT